MERSFTSMAYSETVLTSGVVGKKTKRRCCNSPTDFQQQEIMSAQNLNFASKLPKMEVFCPKFACLAKFFLTAQNLWALHLPPATASHREMQNEKIVKEPDTGRFSLK